MPIITAWAVAVCGIFYMFQTLQVSRARGTAGVSIGDGGDKMLLRRIRGQGNAAEQMPLTLLALGMAELMGGATWILLLLAVVFTGARIAHGYAFGWLEHNRPLRFYGMLLSSLSSLGILGYLGILALLASF